MMKEISSDVYIIAARRTAIGSFNGQFADITSMQLGSAVIKSFFTNLEMEESDISEVIMGQVLTADLGPNPASSAAVGANIPASVPASVVNMACASGLKAVYLAYQAIKQLQATLVVCGGQESTSKAPETMKIPTITGIGEGKFIKFQMNKTAKVLGLEDSSAGRKMLRKANELAASYNISREEQDFYAYRSIIKARKAALEDSFKEEIVHIQEKICKDEIIKANAETTMGTLSGTLPLLGQSVVQHSSITAGNSAQLSDGAAALILCNEFELAILNETNPFAKIVAFVEVEVDLKDAGIGSVQAIQEILKMTSWTRDDVDLYEIQETYAVQALIVIKKLELDNKKVNISGGAIALGHPLGASGACMLVTLVHNLRRLKLNKGIVSLCNGAGLALAVAVEAPQIQ